MQKNIKYLKAVFADFVYRLRDIRFAGQVLFVIIVLMISWSGVKAIQLNYKLQKQIATAKQENTIQQLENNNQRLENIYYNSKQYLDLQARANFGLASPGEKEIFVPLNVAISYEPKINTNLTTTPRVGVPKVQNNIQSWFNYFLHRK